jgi:hypothetical protein
MSQWRMCASVLGGLLLTGCTAASAATGAAGHVAADAAGHTAADAAGRVTGKLVMEGGPIGPGGKQPGERPIPGTVTFITAGHRPVNVGVGSSGRFSAWLAPGRYHVAGRSPDIITVTGSGRHVEQTCSQPSSVTVRARHTTTITVVCIVP